MAATFQAGEEGGSPLGIKVRSDLVEEKDRRIPTMLRDQFGMGQHGSHGQNQNNAWN